MTKFDLNAAQRVYLGADEMGGVLPYSMRPQGAAGLPAAAALAASPGA
jgi:hypothetical protein